MLTLDVILPHLLRVKRDMTLDDVERELLDHLFPIGI